MTEVTNTCCEPTITPLGQNPLVATDNFKNTVCLYNLASQEYEQYFRYVTTNPDGSSNEFYLLGNLGTKLTTLPAGRLTPCVEDVHVVNSTGKIYATLDCNNEQAVKVFDKCVVSTLDRVSSGIGQLSSGLLAISSTLSTINNNVMSVKNSIDAAAATITSIDTQISSNLRPLLQQTRDHIANPALGSQETSVSLTAGIPARILGASNRRVAIVTWYSSTNPRAILNIGYNGSATINKGTALAFRQAELIYGWMSKGEIWGVSSHDIVLNTVDFID